MGDEGLMELPRPIGTLRRRRFGKNVIAAYVRERVSELDAPQPDHVPQVNRAAIHELERLYDHFKLGEIGR